MDFLAPSEAVQSFQEDLFTELHFLFHDWIADLYVKRPATVQSPRVCILGVILTHKGYPFIRDGLLRLGGSQFEAVDQRIHHGIQIFHFLVPRPRSVGGKSSEGGNQVIGLAAEKVADGAVAG